MPIYCNTCFLYNILTKYYIDYIVISFFDCFYKKFLTKNGKLKSSKVILDFMIVLQIDHYDELLDIEILN